MPLPASPPSIAPFLGSSSLEALETSPPSSDPGADPSIGATPDPWQQAAEACDSEAATDAPHPLELQSAPQRAAHHRHQHERWAVVNALWQPDVHTLLRKRAVRMGRCCQMPTLRLNATGAICPALTRCRDRLCPLCSDKRGRVAARRTARLVERFNATRFLTLTLKHRGEHLNAMATRGTDAFTRLRETSTWRKHVKGGVWAAETTRNPTTGEWHHHLHVIIDGTYFPQPVLKELWLSITGDSSIVHVKAVHDRAAAAKYITRYVAKPLDLRTWPPPAIREYAEAMHGRRLLQTFGTAHNTRTDADDQPEPPNPTTHLIHSAQLITASAEGHRSAQHARWLIARMGREHAMAVGVNPASILDTSPPSLAEHRFALDVCAALHRLPRGEWAAYNLPACGVDDDPPPSFPLDADPRDPCTWATSATETPTPPSTSASS